MNQWKYREYLYNIRKYFRDLVEKCSFMVYNTRKGGVKHGRQKQARRCQAI